MVVPDEREDSCWGNRGHPNPREGPGAVDVALYATASVDAVVASHPEVGWEHLRAVGKGRRSPLALLRPAPAPA
ncbi:MULTISPECIES: hypothetical protein [unclassified Streptomyces]|uniref:hypothetical protein n=1 Tax=unclassified Streptomyces TaxID=2593676 RepID=UPI00336ADC98